MTAHQWTPSKQGQCKRRRAKVVWVWQFGLYPLDEQRTRLVTRGTERVPSTPLWRLGMRVMEPASFIMTRRFMLGVKERAEGLRGSAPPRTAPPRSAPTEDVAHQPAGEQQPSAA